MAALVARRPAPAQPTEILPAEKLVAGMSGLGRSDLGEREGIQRFDVEIIGLSAMRRARLDPHPRFGSGGWRRAASSPA
jgi:hypothetical protein